MNFISHRTGMVLILFLALGQIGCGSGASFEGSGSSDSSSTNEVRGAGETEVTAAGLSYGVCGYPRFPLPLAAKSGCSSTMSVTRNLASATNSYLFSVYNASNLTSGSSTLAAQGLSGSRYIGDMKVNVAANHAANSVDLVLVGYEPTRWIIEGNVSAVRSVLVGGMYCGEVSGVPSTKVSVHTVQQDLFGGFSTGAHPENFRKAAVLYEGTCIDRTFLAD
jgi:hypothetical protein